MSRLAYFLTLIWLSLLFLRPTDLFYTWKDFPALNYLFIALGPITLLSGQRFFAGAQFPLLASLIFAIGISVIMSGWLTGGLIAMREFLPAAAAFYLVVENCKNAERIRKVFWLFVISALIMVLHGISQQDDGLGWTGIPWVVGRITYAGFFNDPNDLGLMLICSLPLLAYIKDRAASLFTVGIYWATAILLGYGIILTGSRGTMLGLAIPLLLYYAERSGKWKTAIISIAAIPAILTFLPERFQELDPSESSAFSRLDAWYAGFQMLIANPVFGVGFGRFVDEHGRTAHNSFVLAFAELGTLGYFLWLALVLVICRALWLHYREQVTTAIEISDEQKLSRALLYSLVAFGVGSFFLSRTYNPLLFALLGLACAHVKNLESHEEWPAGTSLIRVDKTAILICVASLPAIAVLIKILYQFV